MSIHIKFLSSSDVRVPFFNLFLSQHGVLGSVFNPFEFDHHFLYPIGTVTNSKYECVVIYVLRE